MTVTMTIAIITPMIIPATAPPDNPSSLLPPSLAVLVSELKNSTMIITVYFSLLYIL